ncbi:hypothetical protein G7Z17_g12109 [Cylindrodendrum hubeiense]|uniref:Uncharacterized protein n=1 Tax=Cylindrodendrum hubeiense TaxID=595255 RepID=A0A9P5GW02_9HYPO|nr:hypothetical protein G7Z17_g12109 [Cylindrodendrum hubeiense]
MTLQPDTGLTPKTNQKLIGRAAPSDVGLPTHTHKRALPRMSCPSDLARSSRQRSGAGASILPTYDTSPFLAWSPGRVHRNGATVHPAPTIVTVVYGSRLLWHACALVAPGPGQAELSPSVPAPSRYRAPTTPWVPGARKGSPQHEIAQLCPYPAPPQQLAESCWTREGTTAELHIVEPAHRWRALNMFFCTVAYREPEPAIAAMNPILHVPIQCELWHLSPHQRSEFLKPSLDDERLVMVLRRWLRRCNELAPAGTNST